MRTMSFFEFTGKLQWAVQVKSNRMACLISSGLRRACTRSYGAILRSILNYITVPILAKVNYETTRTMTETMHAINIKCMIRIPETTEAIVIFCAASINSGKSLSFSVISSPCRFRDSLGACLLQCN